MNATAEINVLHVDDDASFVNVSKRILKVQGHGHFRIETASSVDEALKKLAQKSFDVVVSDYYMSSKTGLDLLKTIRESGSDTPFILFTGKGREEIIVQAINLGADRYIDKHGDPEAVYTELAVSIYQTHEKAQAKKLLWQSEERFRKMMANSKDLIMLTGNDGVILYLSSSCKNILGYEPSELIGKVPWIVHPDDLTRVQKIFNNALTTEVNGSAEYRIVTKLDEVRWVSHSFSQIIESGNIIQIINIIRDITETKNAETKLRESKELFRLAVRHVPIMMAALNKDLQYTWVYNSSIELPKDVIGKNFGEVLNILNCGEVRSSMFKLLKSAGFLEREVSVKVKNSLMILDCCFESIQNEKGEITGIRFAACDITKQKELEKTAKN